MAYRDIERAVREVLARVGFANESCGWSRARHDFVDIVDLQRSKSDDMITVNLGLMHEPTYAMVWGKPPSRPVTEVECIVRKRLGHLIDGCDRWWAVADKAAPTDIASTIQAAALPFFSSFKILEDVERELDAGMSRYPPEVLYLAAAKRQSGKSEQARQMLLEVQSRTPGAWSERISRFIAADN